MRPLCIHHHPCADGFAAAWVIRRAFGEEIEFHPGVYGQAPPDVAGREVILVDFSYPREVLLGMAEQARSVLILDHHESAQQTLVDLPGNVVAHFDMGHSGAMIAWGYCFPAESPPALLRHVEDRDLGRWALDGTREIMAAVYSHPYDFAVWDRLMRGDLYHLFQEGESILRAQNKTLRELIEHAAGRDLVGGYLVPVLNAPYHLATDAGALLSRGELFAATWYEDGAGMRHYSLRSDRDTPEALNVAIIARSYGGGGHRHAAGFRLHRNELERLLHFPLVEREPG